MKRTILLADDSPTIRRLVTQTFSDANFKIVEVNNGDAAIRTFEEVRPNVVLADIYMPGKSGYQVCAYIRSHSELGKTPVVLLVGAFEAFDEDTAKQAGATASITKPFEPGALIELVKSVLKSNPDDSDEHPSPVASHTMTPVVAERVAPASSHSVLEQPGVEGDSDDLLGLKTIFKDETTGSPAGVITEEDIDRIADRVIQKLSPKMIESIAWEVVPDIAAKVVSEELKRVK
jgi:CheY-like chemotaxis protein